MASLFTSQTPASQTSEANPGPTLGIVIVPSVDGQVTHLMWYAPASLPSNAATLPFVLYDATTQAELGRVVPGSITASAWNTAALSSPVNVTAGTRLIAAVRTADNYAYTGGFFASSGLTNGVLSSPATGSDPVGNGRFASAADAYPGSTFGGHSYFTDIVFVPTAAAGTVVEPLVVTAPKPITPRTPGPVILGRGSLADDPVLTTPRPLTVTAPAVRPPSLATLLRNPAPDVIAAGAATPEPLVVAAPAPAAVPARPFLSRGSLADLLAATQPMVVTGPATVPRSAAILSREPVPPPPAGPFGPTTEPLVVTAAIRPPVGVFRLLVPTRDTTCDGVTHRPSTGITVRPGAGTTARPSVGVTTRPVAC